jgi:hypothetical protein
MEQNKTGKYLKYAIGEIILVMVGILLALQVNNWNEVRINDKKVTLIFEEIQEDLLEDVKDINKAMLMYSMKDSLTHLILNNQLNYDDFKNDLTGKLFNHTLDYARIQISNNAFLKLVDNADNLSIEQLSIYNTLKLFYGEDRLRFAKQIGRIDNLVYQNIHDLAESKKWYHSNIDIWNENDTIINYFLKDFYYKNQVKEYDIVSNLNLPIIRMRIVKFYQLIESVKDSPRPLPEFLENILVSPEMLNEYAGVYKAKDSIYVHGELWNEFHTINDRGMFIGDYKMTLFKISKDKFSDASSYNNHFTFQRNSNNEIIGMEHDWHGHNLKMKKIE